jgi:hypothetical protein
MAKYKVLVTYPNGASIRPTPSTNNSAVGIYPQGATFYASDIVSDLTDPTNQDKRWAVVESDPVDLTKYTGRYVAVEYPGTSGPIDRADEEPITSPPPPDPPPTDGAITVHVELNDNGTIYSGDVSLTQQ